MEVGVLEMQIEWIGSYLSKDILSEKSFQGGGRIQYKDVGVEMTLCHLHWSKSTKGANRGPRKVKHEMMLGGK